MPAKVHAVDDKDFCAFVLFVALHAGQRNRKPQTITTKQSIGMTRFADLSGIVLAAGRSARMEGANKLLLPWQKQCVLQVVVERMCAVGVGEVVVVTGHQRPEVEEKLSRYPVRLAHNPDFANGMAGSMRVGVEAAGGEQGYLFALGDMPQVTGETMLKVAEALKSSAAIAVPVCAGRRGHPVAIGRAHRNALLALAGDRGARSVLANNPTHIVEVPVADEGIFSDVDTPESYWKLRGTNC